MRSPGYLARAVLATLAGALGCASILDIEQAHVDERLAEKEQVEQNVAGSAGQSGSDAGPEASLCERYCSLIMTNCTGTFAQYAAPENCLAACQALPEGEPGALAGNNVHCRLRNAELAPTEPPTYCTVAGPSGGNVCGTLCDAYCVLMETACGAAHYPDLAACAVECSALPDLGDYAVDSSQRMFSGSHAQCRLYHVNAALLDAEFHCPHASGGPPCQDSADD